MKPSLQSIVLDALLLGLVASSPAAHAELKVRMPTVTWREIEFEHNGLVTFGRKGSKFDRAQSYTNELAYGVTPWWQVEFESALVSGAGTTLRSEAFAFENTFQLTEPGEYWFNWGLFVEFEHGTTPGSTNAFTFGPLIQREQNLFGLRTLHTINLFLSRDVGANASRATPFSYAWQSVALLHPLFNPGFELHGGIPDLGNAGRYNQQFHMIGPVITGAHNLGNHRGTLRYEVGYQFGLTSNSPTGAVRWRLEYEIAF
ncbi:MAG: hypothetical protein ACJ8AW_49080 [Rhodopila sp.]